MATLKKFKVTYKVGKELQSDVWHAENAQEALRCARDDYRASYDDFKCIVSVEAIV